MHRSYKYNKDYNVPNMNLSTSRGQGNVISEYQ